MLNKNGYLKYIENKYKNSINDISDLIGDDEPSKLFPILIKLFGHLLENDPNKSLSDSSMIARKYANYLLRVVGPFMLKRKQVFEDRNILMYGDNYDKNYVPKIYSNDITLPTEPVIWAANHGFKDDVLATMLAAKRNAYILFGSLPQFYNTIDGVAAWINGVTMSNRKNHNSKIAAFEKSKIVLSKGKDLLILPEGVWNKSPNQLILELWPGIYNLSKEGNYKVVPVIHYIKDKTENTSTDLIHTVIDDPISFEGMNEKEGLEYLRDILATWYYLMMERYGNSTYVEELKEYNNSQEAWEQMLKNRVNTADRYDTPIEISADYRSKNITRLENVYEKIANLNITKENVIEVEYAKQLIKEIKTNDYQRRF